MKRLFALAAPVLLALFLTMGAGGKADATPTTYLNAVLTDGAVPHPRVSFSLDNQNPTDLAVKVERALADHRGIDAYLEPEKCSRTDARLRACGTLRSVFDAYRYVDPDATNLRTVEDLPAYLRSLQPTISTDTVEYWSACVVPQAHGPPTVYIRCIHRRLLPGERKWMNPATGRFVGFEHCANPSLGPYLPPPCAFVLFRAEDGDEFGNVGALARSNITPAEEAACPIAFQGPRSNGQFSESGYHLLATASDHVCDFAEDARVLNMQIHTRGCIRLSRGWWAVRVPARFATDDSLRVVICITKRDGTQSFGMGVPPPEYHTGSDRKAVAVVWYSQAEAQASRTTTDLWWRWVPR